jgi:hypothetical protein
MKPKQHHSLQGARQYKTLTASCQVMVMATFWPWQWYCDGNFFAMAVILLADASAAGNGNVFAMAMIYC